MEDSWLFDSMTNEHPAYSETRDTWNDNLASTEVSLYIMIVSRLILWTCYSCEVIFVMIIEQYMWWCSAVIFVSEVRTLTTNLTKWYWIILIEVHFMEQSRPNQTLILCNRMEQESNWSKHKCVYCILYTIVFYQFRYICEEFRTKDYTCTSRHALICSCTPNVHTYICILLCQLAMRLVYLDASSTSYSHRLHTGCGPSKRLYKAPLGVSCMDGVLKSLAIAVRWQWKL